MGKQSHKLSRPKKPAVVADEIDLEDAEDAIVVNDTGITAAEVLPVAVDADVDDVATSAISPVLVDEDFDDIELPIVPSSSGELVQYDPLQSYLAEIRHIPQLSKDEEHALAVRYFEEHDEVAGYRLVLANLRLVVMIAREYQRNLKNILDLIQEGNIGLLEAIKQYDPFRGIRFPTYAAYWVRAYMLRYLINNVRLVKIGTTQAQRKLFFNLRKEKERLEAEGFVPEAKLLAKRLDVKESEVLEMEQRLSLPDLSVDTPLGVTRDPDDAFDLHGVLPSSEENPEDRVVREQFVGAIRQVVEELDPQLDDKERAIVRDRLLTEEPLTLQEVADKFGLSRERIRQIEARLRDKLKVQLRERLALDEKGEGGVE